MREISFKSYSVRDFWRFLDKRCFAIPELQREFVWDARKTCLLLDSIYKRLPIGTILIWRTDRKNRNLLRHTLKALPPFDEINKEIWFLMDGQQRISVLHQIREGKEVPSSRGRTVNFRDIQFSLHPEETARFIKHRRPDPKSHVPVVDIVSSGWRRRLSRLRKSELDQVEKFRTKIKNYRVPVIFVKTQDINEVRESFIRINALGTPISAADRAFARASTLRLRHLVDQAKSQWEHGFGLLPSEIINIALALAYGEKDVGERAVNAALAKIEKRIKGGDYSNKQFTKAWRGVKEGLGRAIDYLVSNFGVLNLSFLPSTNMVATLGLFFYFNNLAQPNSQQRRELRKWFWATAVGKRYTGRGYRQNILKDVAFFKRLGQKRNGRFDFKEKVLKYDVRRADYSQKSGLTDAFLCMLIRRGPRYLHNGEPIIIDGSSSRSNRKDKHHIFSRDSLKKAGFAPSDYNSLCNICYIAAEENQSFGNKKPVRYLAEFRKRKHFSRVMKSHLIPYGGDSGLWVNDIRRGYRRFVKERIDIICKVFEREAGMQLFRSE